MERASLGGPDGLEEVCSVKSHGAGMTDHGDLPALPASSGLEVLLGLAVRPRPLVGPLQAASVSTGLMSPHSKHQAARLRDGAWPPGGRPRPRSS